MYVPMNIVYVFYTAGETQVTSSERSNVLFEGTYAGL